MRIKTLTISISLFLTVSLVGYSQEKDVNFDKDYVKANNQKTTIEINEAQELTYIILAITDFGKENPNMTKQNTAYFDNVKNIFTHFRISQL